MIINAKHPLLSISKQLAPICEPLNIFGIHHFSYIKQFANGKSLNISNKPQWIYDYYNLKLYNSSIFDKSKLDSQSKFEVWLGDYDIDVYHHGKLYYNTSHTISITESHHDSAETYLFSTTPENSQVINQLVSRRELLYHFIAYLKDRASKLFLEADKNKLSLICKHSELVIKATDDSIDHLIEKFYNSTKIYKYYLKLSDVKQVKLSEREIDCLAHLLENKSAKETAKLMNLSRRTVESYLENIRLKVNCDNKKDLLRIIARNKYLRSLRVTKDKY